MTSPRGEHRAGFVALVGRPNVGKSTLMNQVLGRKLAIVTPKPQTTRNRILGVESRPGVQFLFVDTPGLHEPHNLLGERMVKAARQSLAEADVALLVIDATSGVTDADRALAAELGSAKQPVVVALNKIDRVPKARLIELAGELDTLLPGRHVVPVSALVGDNVPELLRTLEAHLPVSPPLFPPDVQTDLPERFFAAEIVREQILLATHEEVPYQSAVRVDAFDEREGRNLVVIEATILVARPSQRAIVLGEKGARIKHIGQNARRELESFLGSRVYLDLHVKVDEKWFTKPHTLGELGL
ncbi:MAG: GTPase Era [Thermodesulfobacteriota bacterium]